MTEPGKLDAGRSDPADPHADLSVLLDIVNASGDPEDRAMAAQHLSACERCLGTAVRLLDVRRRTDALSDVGTDVEVDEDHPPFESIIAHFNSPGGDALVSEHLAECVTCLEILQQLDQIASEHEARCWEEEFDTAVSEATAPVADPREARSAVVAFERPFRAAQARAAAAWPLLARAALVTTVLGAGFIAGQTFRTPAANTFGLRGSAGGTLTEPVQLVTVGPATEAVVHAEPQRIVLLLRVAPTDRNHTFVVRVVEQSGDEAGRQTLEQHDSPVSIVGENGGAVVAVWLPPGTFRREQRYLVNWVRQDREVNYTASLHAVN